MDSALNRPQTSSSVFPRTEIRLTAFENWIHENSISGDSISSRTTLSLPASPEAYSQWQKLSPRAPAYFTIHRLPPARTVLHVIDAFYEYSGTMLYVIPRQEVLDNYRCLYTKSSIPPDRLPVRLAELCGILACGCDHAMDVPDEFAEACRDTVKMMLDEVTEQYELRGMRLFTLCCMFSLLERPIAAWSYCGAFFPFLWLCANLIELAVAGSKISEQYGLQDENPRTPVPESQQEWIMYRKTWRTLKFLER